MLRFLHGFHHFRPDGLLRAPIRRSRARSSKIHFMAPLGLRGRYFYISARIALAWSAVLSAVLLYGVPSIRALLMLLPSFPIRFSDRCSRSFTASDGGA